MNFTELLMLRAREANEKFKMFSADERVLVGFSGGADSLALLCVMHAVLGENVYAFHVNHMLRGNEADADELFCKNFCEEKGIRFNSARVDVPSLARALHGGGAIEETAREARYAALAKECERIGARKIALAHTASDNTETVIFNLSRGTALAGLRGIPPKRAHMSAEIIRPLILCTREEIEGYCKENSLPYRTDSTNADVHYKRNFIRKKIMPLLMELNPALHKRVAAMCGSLRCDEDFIKGEAYRFVNENAVHGEPRISAQKLLSIHKAVRTRVLAAMFARACGESLEEKHYADIEDMLACGREGARIILPGKTSALIRNGELLFISEKNLAEENKKIEFYKRVPPGGCNFGGMFATFFYRKGTEDESVAEAIEEFSENAVLVRKTEIPESTAKMLRVRNRESGDKYAFGGMTRTLKKLLTGETETAKKRRPVFCDEKGIFWFPSFRLRDDVYTSEEKTYILYYFEYKI
jgi:tRNA(Ile)-lysidine synthase